MSDEVTAAAWPKLPGSEWFATLETFHLWTQIIGKVRMVQAPWLNHSWSVPLYVSARGMSTSLVPYGSEGFEFTFDVFADRLTLSTTTGEQRSVALRPRTVADFFQEVMQALVSVEMPVSIHLTPSEIPDAVPFDQDTIHDSYEPTHVRAFWRALVQTHRVMSRFRAGFLGKASPVHFFWGSFDLAVTRFSGRTAPPHPGGLPNFPIDVAREAYSHEVTSCGFWPGNRQSPMPMFYAYAYPTPDGLGEALVGPDEAVWNSELGEFILPYSALLASSDPDAALLRFFESTHAAAAELARWDRRDLECSEPQGPDWWRQRARKG